MENKNIPVNVLAKGISEDGFKSLSEDIKNAVIEEGLNELNKYNEVIEEVKAQDISGDTEDWCVRFEKQLIESNVIIKENYNKIEELFNKIFSDWEEYQKKHVEEIVVGDKDE